MLDIQFDPQFLNQQTQIILNASTIGETKAVQQSYNIIINTAKQFNEKYQIIKQKIDIFENNLKQTIKSWHTFKMNAQTNGIAFKNTTQYDQYLRNRQKIKRESFSTQIQAEILKTYILGMQFQEYLNAALGQQVSTAYVWMNSKNQPQTYVINDMSDFLKVDIDRYGNVVVRYRNNVNLLRQHAQKVENSIQENNSDFNYALLKTSYAEIYNRYQMHKVKGGSFILWLYPYKDQKWNGVLVSSFGSINEAYATILLHQHYNPMDIPQDNIEVFMNHVMGVTNLSGTLQGDTTVQNMEVAIKSKNATTLSIQQLFKISQDLISQKLNNFSAIQNYLTQVKKANKQAERAINISLKQALNGVTSDAINAVNQILKI